MKALKINGYEQLVAENEERIDINEIMLIQTKREGSTMKELSNFVGVSVNYKFIVNIYGILVKDGNDYFIYSNDEVDGCRHIISRF